MKYSTNEIPATFQRWSCSETLVTYEYVEKQRTIEEETITEYECSAVVVTTEATYPKVVEAMVREEYTVSDELAILRQKDTKTEEFANYNIFVETCKEKAKKLFEE